MGWWRSVLRSLWSSLSKEVREHVGTDHLGNKYYYIAQYKNWRADRPKKKGVEDKATTCQSAEAHNTFNTPSYLPDVGFPSECCEYVLLPLVNKEAALAYGRAEHSKAGNPSRDRGGKKVESGRHHVAAQEARGQTIREKRIVEAADRKELDYEAGDIPTEWEAWIRRTRKTPPTMEEILKNEKYREEIKAKSKDFYEKDKLGKETSEELLPPPAIQIKGHASAPYFGKEEPSVAPTSTGKTFQPGSWMPEDDKRQNQ